jgi:hypothetical protein
MPLVRHSSKAEAAEPRTASRSQRSVRVGMTEASSSWVRAAGDTRAIRARTASRTIKGTPGVSLARTSVTKKGLPPVTAKSCSAGRSACWARHVTAFSESGASLRRATAVLGRSPITDRRCRNARARGRCRDAGKVRRTVLEVLV